MAQTLITSLDAPSGGVFAFTGLTLTSYYQIEIVATALVTSTDGTDIKLTFYVSGSEVTSTYQWALFSTTSAAVNLSDSGTAQAAIWLCSDNASNDLGNAAGKNANFTCVVDQPGSTALHKRAHYDTTLYLTGGNLISIPGVALMANAGAIDGIKVSGSSSLDSGKVRILGLA